jgi:hypothetical protein
MDAIVIALLALVVGLIGGCVIGSRYRDARNAGATRPQALKAAVGFSIEGGGGPPRDP